MLHLQVILVTSMVQHAPRRYGNTYRFPGWAESVTWIVTFLSVMWIPVGAVHELLLRKGTFMAVRRAILHETKCYWRISSFFYISKINYQIQSKDWLWYRWVRLDMNLYVVLWMHSLSPDVEVEGVCDSQTESGGEVVFVCRWRKWSGNRIVWTLSIWDPPTKWDMTILLTDLCC